MNEVVEAWGERRWLVASAWHVMWLAVVVLACVLALPRGAAAVRTGLTASVTASAASAGVQESDAAEQARDREEAARDREQEARDREQEARDREQERQEREQDLYDEGTEALDEGHWQAALTKFDQLVAANTARSDAALYWKAYAQSRLGQRNEALATLRELPKRYPRSRWAKDAAALQVEVQQSSGQKVSPEAQSDEELKMLALNGLMNSDPETAVPLLEKFLRGNGSLKLKERALFVLSQSNPGRDAVARIARDGSDGLQAKAIQNLGLFGGEQSRAALADIYKSSNDPEIRRTILRSFMISGDRDRLLAVARTEASPDLRREAIRQLGVAGGRQQLLELYKNENSPDLRKEIVRALFIGGAAEELNEIAHSDRDAEVRREAVRSLGLMGGERTGSLLMSIYNGEKDREIRRAVIQGLFLQNNAHALIEIARKETDPELKRFAINQLSLTHSRETTQFMMELLNK